MTKTWLQIMRMALELMTAIRDKTQRTCPNENCPLKLNKKKLTSEEQVNRHKEMYKRNHPDGK